ncbi:MAG: hypothetical protein IPL53_08435 [Ignavibacteria bacterium]|nr:hypothetical protein [Ignavibacteria bacterium]
MNLRFYNPNYLRNAIFENDIGMNARLLAGYAWNGLREKGNSNSRVMMEVSLNTIFQCHEFPQ